MSDPQKTQMVYVEREQARQGKQAQSDRTVD
jgi:hypothetical protein